MYKYMIKKETNLKFLDEAVNLYQSFWERNWRGHEYKQECNFDGSSKDLDMLGYCEYELGFPEEDYNSAALIWANVIQTNSILDWGRDKKGAVCLFYSGDKYSPFSIRIENYVSDFMYREISQFENFFLLTEKVLIDIFLTEISTEPYKKLIKIVKSFEDDSYSERLIYSIQEIYGFRSSKCDELANILTANE